MHASTRMRCLSRSVMTMMAVREAHLRLLLIPLFLERRLLMLPHFNLVAVVQGVPRLLVPVRGGV